MTEQVNLSNSPWVKQLQWGHSNNTLTITENEIHLWWLSLALNNDQAQVALKLLNTTQKDKYARRVESLKKPYLAGRYYLIHLLAHYLNLAPKKVIIHYGALNKPFVQNGHPNLQFNFTDTSQGKHHYGLFAFCIEKQLGVDVECADRQIDLARIAKRRFSAAEQEFIKLSDNGYDKHKALAIWTRKEAYGKAIGKGINFVMRERELIFQDKEMDQSSYQFDNQNQSWRLEQYCVENQFIASIVHEGKSAMRIKAFNHSHLEKLFKHTF